MKGRKRPKKSERERARERRRFIERKGVIERTGVIERKRMGENFYITLIKQFKNAINIFVTENRKRKDIYIMTSFFECYNDFERKMQEKNILL